MNDLELLIDSAKKVIRASQQADGGFSHLSSTDNDNFENGDVRLTSFFTANIVASLGVLPGVDDIKARGVIFLLTQKSDRWSFNYWANGTKERELLPYPDDLDDTALALLALLESGAKEVDGAALAQVTQTLTALETEEGGPYRTWLVGADSKPEWVDVDVAVNANIGRLLAKLGITLPKLNAFIGNRIGDKNFISPYYPDEYPVLYFISSFYKGDALNELREKIIALGHGEAGRRNVLQSALLITSLISLEEHDLVENEVRIMADRIKREGWQPYAFCIDPSRKGKRCYAGAAALTAAFGAEAFAQYTALNKRMAQSASEEIISKIDPRIAAIKERARQRIGRIPPSLRTVVLEQLEATNDPKIMLLPFSIAASLGGSNKKGSVIEQDFLEQLGLVNLYGWMAYTIYDDFLDGEGNSRLLSAANYFLRELTSAFLSMEEKAPGISKIYADYMNTIDDANTEEQEHSMAVDALGDRSIGHALPAIAILLHKGYPADSAAIEKTKNFFKHYLIARQLHDDAHDWERDLLRGRINSVGVRLLRGNGGNGSSIDINSGVTSDIPSLQKIFWREAIDGIVDDVVNHIAIARKEITALQNIFVHTDFFDEMLQALEAAARKTIIERDEAAAFLREYAQ